MIIYYKAVREDGTDFYSGTINYAAKLGNGVIRPRSPKRDSYECCTADVLHAADTPTETLIDGEWPCRLFEVEGAPVAEEGHKFGFRQLRVIREIDAHAALGPQGREVAALIDRAHKITPDEAEKLHASRYAAWTPARVAARAAAGYAASGAAWVAAEDAAGDAARYAARSAAGYAVWAAARDAAEDAAQALVVRDLIGQHGLTQDHYDALARPWRTAIGPIHADDKELT